MAIARYQKKIGGPLLDRIDIHVEVPRVDYEKLADLNCELKGKVSHTDGSSSGSFYAGNHLDCCKLCTKLISSALLTGKYQIHIPSMFSVL